MEGFERSVKQLFRGTSCSGDRRILQDINRKNALLVLQNSRTNPSPCAKRNVNRTHGLRSFYFTLGSLYNYNLIVYEVIEMANKLWYNYIVKSNFKEKKQ